MTFTNLIIGLPAMLLCLMVQSVVAFWCVRYYVRQASHAPENHRFVAGLRPLLVTMLALTAGNFVQITLWGTLFIWLGEFDVFYVAIYHSAVNFASLGYGDIVMSDEWKLLGPLEAVNGVLMLGMTSAALMVILQQLVKAQRNEILPGGGAKPKVNRHQNTSHS